MEKSAPTTFSTVSMPFLKDWLGALGGYCEDEQINAMLSRSGLLVNKDQLNARVTLDQIVNLYQAAVTETGDEMMGLWSRPIRTRALQHLLTAIREASTLSSAIYRFSTFWNLLLDDYQFRLVEGKDHLGLSLVPSSDNVSVQRFGHMLILKLCHGLLSWLAGYEVPVKSVEFMFKRPSFREDYYVIFPASVQFNTTYTTIVFKRSELGQSQHRSNTELKHFLQHAPRDWIFTNYREHAQSLRIREFLYNSDWENCQLSDAAESLNITTRTLIRRLDNDGTSFQAIKDGLRRDIAIRNLQEGKKSIEEISFEVGFSSSANFHRAFKRWTGVTTSFYRN